MDYQDLTHADQQTMARASLKDLEAQHFQVCIQITANRGVQGVNPRELEQRKSAIEQGLRNLRREYAALLAEPVEPIENIVNDLQRTEQNVNGRALYPVEAE